MTFVRSIGRWTMTALVINCIIGTGIFGLPGELTRLLGRASPIAMVLAALGIAIIMGCLAEVASQFAEPGGPYPLCPHRLRSIPWHAGWVVSPSGRCGWSGGLCCSVRELPYSFSAIPAKCLATSIADCHSDRDSRSGELSRSPQRRHSEQHADDSQAVAARVVGTAWPYPVRTSAAGDPCIGDHISWTIELGARDGLPLVRVCGTGRRTYSQRRNQRTTADHPL